MLRRLARFVWRLLPESVRRWLRAVRAGDPETFGAARANSVLRRIMPRPIRRRLTGAAPIDRPSLIERLVASPYVSYRLLKRVDTQRVLRRAPYQQFLEGYTTDAQLGAGNTMGTPDASSFVRAVLFDPGLRNAFGYQDLSVIVALADERAAIQLASRPQYLERLLDDPIILAAFRRRALEEGPQAYATRIAQEIYGDVEYRRAIFDRLALGGQLMLARCGTSTVIASSSDHGVAKELFAAQEFELGVFQRYLALRASRALRYFIDVGANLGTHTLYALREAGFDRALAIEPDPRNLSLLRANLALNDVAERVTVLPLAVAADQGATVLYQSSINWGDSRTFPVDGAGWTRWEVATRSLDRIVEASGFEPAALTIWIDVQGAEYRVLQGALKTLASDADIVIEFWPHELVRNGELSNMIATLRSLERRLVRMDDGVPIDRESVADLAQELLRKGQAGFIDIALLPASPSRTLTFA